MQNKSSLFGVCRLTSAKGRFVKAHILPRALTQIGPVSAPIALLCGAERRPIRRWSSWYDPALVIRSGEDILADYDAFGIDFLRRNHLIWSSWGKHMVLPSVEGQTKPIGVREVSVENPPILRLFFASLLWRAVTTSLFEFSDIKLPDDHIELLRHSLVEQMPLDASFYPMTLVQLVTRAEDHIRAPFRTDMITFSDDGVVTGMIPVFRFYFDGLSFIVRLPHHAESEKLGDAAIGNSERLFVQTMPFEISRQIADFRHNHAEALRHWPSDLAKLGVTKPPFTDYDPGRG